jgi:hypothetical protein
MTIDCGADFQACQIYKLSGNSSPTASGSIWKTRRFMSASCKAATNNGTHPTADTKASFV